MNFILIFLAVISINLINFQFQIHHAYKILQSWILPFFIKLKVKLDFFYFIFDLKGDSGSPNLKFLPS